MSIQKLERVLWRIRKQQKNKYLWKDLRKAIMHEIGTDIRTYNNNKRALKDLEWIKTHKRHKFTLTDKDL